MQRLWMQHSADTMLLTMGNRESLNKAIAALLS